MLAGAAEINVDSVGRILIPDHLKEFAGIKGNVIFAGVHNRVEIWNEKTWNDYKTKVLKDADQMAEKLGDIGAI
jgi:MraZ protein